MLLPGTFVFVLGFLFDFLGGIFLVILRPVLTSPAQGGARCPFRARGWGSYIARSGTFWRPLGVLLARFLTIPPSTPALSHFVIVSIFLHSSRFLFSLPPFPSLICGSDSSRACQSRHSLECYVPFFPSSVLRSRVSRDAS